MTVDVDRDLSLLVVPAAGAVVTSDDPWDPVGLVDGAGERVAAVSSFLRDLQASGRSAATLRSYAMDLLRWFRFGWAIGVVWDQATRVEARDFCRWLALRDKPTRSGGVGRRAAGVAVNPVTGKPGRGTKYAASTRAHSETVLRVFYDFHRDAGTGPMVNPFPLARPRRVGGRTRTTIRWSPSAMSGRGSTAPGWPGGFRGRSRTSCSTGCLPS
jgi:hypothetical protein